MTKKLLADAAKFLPKKFGISGWGVGLNWEISPGDRNTVRAFVAQMEDRRALYNAFNLEVEGDVSWSVKEIRRFSTEALAKLDEQSPAAFCIRAIRQACRRYDDRSHDNFSNVRAREHAGWLIALGELRSTVGYHLRQISNDYDIEVESELASIMPAKDDDNRIEPY